MKRSESIFICFLFVIWRLILFLGFFLGSFFLSQRLDFSSVKLYPNMPYWLIAWANFDGAHYLQIAREGFYGFGQQAFFPFYPLLIKILPMPGPDSHFFAGFLISHVGLLLSLFVAYKLFRLDFGSQKSILAIFSLAIFPTSFFFGSVYNESIFLLFVLAAFYALRKKRWTVACFLGALASLTRLVGIFLWPAFLWEWWKTNEKGKLVSFLSTLLIPLGLVFYMIYLKFTVGDPLAFIHVQPQFGAQRSGGGIILLPQVLFRYLKIFLTSAWNYQYFIAVLEFLSLILALSGLVYLWSKNVRKSYLIFAILVILIPTLTGTLSSMPRYVLPAFPLFLLPAFIHNQFLNFLILALSFVGLLVLTSLFTRGFWVA